MGLDTGLMPKPTLFIPVPNSYCGWNVSPPKDVLISSPPKPGNVALLGKRVVADVIKLSEVTLD